MTSSFRPKLRTVLLLVNLCILLLPLGFIGVFRLYESELIRQTEAALIGQAALLSASYHHELANLAARYQEDIPAGAVLPVDSPFFPRSGFTPIMPELDLATSEILPPGADAVEPAAASSRISLEAGRSLQPLLEQTQRITLSGIRLVDINGVVVASSGSELGLSIAGRVEVRQALAGHYASVLRRRISDEPAPAFSSLSRRGWVRVLVAMPVVHGDTTVGAVLLSRSPLDAGKGLYFLRSHLLTAGLIIVFLVLLVTFFTDWLISRPLKQLVDNAKWIEKHGGVLVPLAHPGTREVADLSGSIKAMADKLVKRSDYIRDFAGHVSHEFKTPLASLRGSIELLADMGEDMTWEERGKFLANMDGDVHRLDKLTRGLLELARADMSRQEHGRCEPGEVVAEVIAYFKARGREVRSSVAADISPVAVDAEILRDVLRNLVANSFLHGHADKVIIDVSLPVQEDGRLQLRVIDDGCGITAQNRERIFVPFFTTARDQGGTGLGLTVCRSLLAAVGGTVELEDGSSGSCVFVLTVPLYEQA